MLAALTIVATLTATPAQTPALEDALRMAYATRWHAAQTWNDQVAAPVVVHPPVGHRPRPTSAGSSWDGVAQCESGGNWATNTGNGYYGGLQMTPAFWASHGGLAYAPRPDLATKAEQETIADRAGSRTPWPVCGKRCSLRWLSAPTSSAPARTSP